jgi:hypothetical protein
MMITQQIIYVHVDVYTLLCVMFIHCDMGCGVFRAVGLLCFSIICLVGGMIFD